MRLDGITSDILVAAKTVVLCQVILAIGVVLFEVFFGNKLDMESSVLGIVMAIIPPLLGFIYASLKVRKNPNYSLRDLMQMSRVVKIIYTFLMFILVFKFLKLDNPVILYAYIFTMVGYFLTPFITTSNRSEYA
ncbi:ATP synthase subunit I [Vibrio artabrorum]|uniref:ATP synthase subunit I n=1 Tax=Vibrio artabrorum TaxID=446374 RepID=A0ABT8CKH4_9VIBR|nr:ATP synthase subunit I [Vibrio artabrorum]MDN3702246.1 ATP synthase subunit I [Vibrio artabrorum]